MPATYTNPWHKPGKPEYGPAIYQTDAAPTEYGGHLIYHRQAQVWDVVKDGACVTQMAGPDGARRAIDAINAKADAARIVDPKSIENLFAWQTHSPDRRARLEVADLETRLQAIRDRAAALQAMPAAAPFEAGTVEALCERHVTATRAYWAAESRCASAMITGPANFPVERNRKRTETAHKRSLEVSAHLQAAQRRLERIAFPHGMGGVVRSADPDAIAKLQAELADRQQWHDHAKAANVTLRKHGAEARPHLEAAGIRADVIDRAMWLTPNGKPWGVNTTNSNAAIRRIEDRIRGLERMKARGTVEKEADGVRIVENAEAARLQLIFPGKPEAAVIAKLKENGFRWSPREGAWQRQLTNNARYAAQRVLAAA